MASDGASLPRRRRVRTPTVLQLESAECGAAALAMILAYHGRRVPLEELRQATGVSRDGSKASNIMAAARRYGLEAHAFKKEPEQLEELELPLIIFWNFNHFLVLEGIDRRGAWLNDPAIGHRRVGLDEFGESFTGVALAFAPGPDFRRGGRRPSVLGGIARRLQDTRAALLFMLVASLCLIVPGLLIPAFTRLFVDYVLIEHVDAWLTGLLLAMLGAAVLRGALVFLQHHHLARLRCALALGGAAQFVWRLLRLPVAYFVQRHAIEVANRNLMSDRVAEVLARDLAATLLNALAIVVYAAVMAQYDLVLTAVGVGFALVNLVCLTVVQRYAADLGRRLQMDDGLVQATTIRAFAMLDTLKATGAENLFMARWAGRHAKVMNDEQELGRIHTLLRAMPYALTAMSGVAIVVIGGLRIMDGAISIGMLLAFQALMTVFSQPVTQLVLFGTQLHELQADIERLDDVLRQRLDRGFRAPVPGPASRLGGGLRVEGLRFGFAPLDPPLIDGFALDLPPGGRIALVGASGSGKSTIGKLIVGLYEPWDGEILIDGRPIASVTRESLRHSVGFVDQSPALFPGTVRDNISLWDPTLSEERIVAAARDAMIHDDIMARAAGYDHRVEEGGRNFSGGQRQRIILARALARAPSLLVLDEATSALDAGTEFQFMQNLRRRGCSCVIVAHRLSTIRDCDEIIVLERGAVVERGRHDALIGRRGRYRALVES